MNQRRQRTTVYHEPGDEGAELVWGEDVYFEHADGVWADGFVVELIYAQFGELGMGLERDGKREGKGRTDFAADPFVEFSGEGCLSLVGLEEVYVDVEAAS